MNRVYTGPVRAKIKYAKQLLVWTSNFIDICRLVRKMIHDDGQVRTAYYAFTLCSTYKECIKTNKKTQWCKHVESPNKYQNETLADDVQQK
jgi:hypothetical protein